MSQGPKRIFEDISTQVKINKLRGDISLLDKVDLLVIDKEIFEAVRISDKDKFRDFFSNNDYDIIGDDMLIDSTFIEKYSKFIRNGFMIFDELFFIKDEQLWDYITNNFRTSLVGPENIIVTR